MENEDYKVSAREDIIYQETFDYFKEKKVKAIDMLPLLHFRLEQGHQSLSLEESITILAMQTGELDINKTNE